MALTRGVIVLAQESRFRLVDSNGRGELYLLSRKAAIEPQDLPRLQRDRTPVIVSHRAAPCLVARLADDIYLADNRSGVLP